MTVINRQPVNLNNNDDYYEALGKRQTNNDKNHYISRNYASIALGSRLESRERQS